MRSFLCSPSGVLGCQALILVDTGLGKEYIEFSHPLYEKGRYVHIYYSLVSTFVETCICTCTGFYFCLKMRDWENKIKAILDMCWFWSRYWNVLSFMDWIWVDNIIKLYNTWIKKVELQMLIDWKNHWDWYWFTDEFVKYYNEVCKICKTYWLSKDFFGILNSFEEHEMLIKQRKELTKKIRKVKWYIYFIKDCHWHIKVWKTKEDKNRVRKYVTENSEPIEVLTLIEYEDYNLAEKRWHEILKDFNYNRERFKIPEEIVWMILKCEKGSFINLNDNEKEVK